MKSNRADRCICNKHMFERFNEGTCLWCGHGPARMVTEQAYGLNMVQTSSPLDSRVVPLRQAKSFEWDEDSIIAAYRAWEFEYGKPPSSTDWQQARNGIHRPSYQAVRRILGGWEALKTAVAMVPRDQAA